MDDRNPIPESTFRGALRLTALLLATLILLPLCAIILLGASAFGRNAREKCVMTLTPAFSRIVAASIGLSISVAGRRDPRARVFVGNHVTYLDILVAGAGVGGVFVSRHDVKDWPVIGLFARLAGTVFIDRRSLHSAVESAADVSERIGRGVRITLFPEGGTTGGLSVGPFKPFLFHGLTGSGTLIQPFTINYALLGRGKLTQERRGLIYWFDPAPSFPAHGWRLLKLPRTHATITFGEPVGTPVETGKDAARELAEQLRERVAARLEPLPSGQSQSTQRSGAIRS